MFNGERSSAITIGPIDTKIYVLCLRYPHPAENNSVLTFFTAIIWISNYLTSMVYYLKIVLQLSGYYVMIKLAVEYQLIAS